MFVVAKGSNAFLLAGHIVDIVAAIGGCTVSGVLKQCAAAFPFSVGTWNLARSTIKIKVPTNCRFL